MRQPNHSLANGGIGILPGRNHCARISHTGYSVGDSASLADLHWTNAESNSGATEILCVYGIRAKRPREENWLALPSSRHGLFPSANRLGAVDPPEMKRYLGCMTPAEPLSPWQNLAPDRAASPLAELRSPHADLCQQLHLWHRSSAWEGGATEAKDPDDSGRIESFAQGAPSLAKHASFPFRQRSVSVLLSLLRRAADLDGEPHLLSIASGAQPLHGQRYRAAALGEGVDRLLPRRQVARHDSLQLQLQRGARRAPHKPVDSQAPALMELPALP
eukprot:scaffold959_cov258-Pinguiococcus_pyrenoidosus.AAC.8